MSGFIGRSSCIGIPPSLTIFAFFLCKRRSWFFFILAICSSSLRDMMTIIQKMKCRREIHTSSSRAYPCQHHLSAQDYPLTSVPLQWPGDCACRHEWRQHLWQFRYSIVRRSRLMIESSAMVLYHKPTNLLIRKTLRPLSGPKLPSRSWSKETPWPNMGEVCLDAPTTAVSRIQNLSNSWHEGTIYLLCVFVHPRLLTWVHLFDSGSQTEPSRCVLFLTCRFAAVRQHCTDEPTSACSLPQLF